LTSLSSTDSYFITILVIINILSQLSFKKKKLSFIMSSIRLVLSRRQRTIVSLSRSVGNRTLRSRISLSLHCCKCASLECNDQRIARTISITKGRNECYLSFSQQLLPRLLHLSCSIQADSCSILAEQLFHSSWYDPVAQLYRPSYQSLDHRSLTIVNIHHPG
jgi:hypothetical protein